MNQLAPSIVLAALVYGVTGISGGGLTRASGNAVVSERPAASNTTGAPAKNQVKISSAKVSGLGPVLVNAKGRTLYIFIPDHGKKVTCTGNCASMWPPVVVKASQKPDATGAVKQSMLGSDPNPNKSGGRVVTYNGWPLYTFVSDYKAGLATGQALKQSGGLWYAISPTGKVIKKKVNKKH